MLGTGCKRFNQALNEPKKVKSALVENTNLEKFSMYIHFEKATREYEGTLEKADGTLAVTGKG